MSVKIAVFLQDNIVRKPSVMMLRSIVFEQAGGGWNEINQFYVNISPDLKLCAVRGEIRKLIGRLADCRVAAGPQFSGVLYRELDNHGFSIFEAQDFSPDTLDGILRDLAQQPEAMTSAVPTRPVETETPGVFQLDLLRLQNAHPEITSKQALQEFLETTPFYELRLVCAHVPPWLENDLYDIHSTTAGKTITAAIRKKQRKGG